MKPYTAPTERGAALDSCYKHIASTEHSSCSGFQPRLTSTEHNIQNLIVLSNSRYFYKSLSY